MRGLVQAWAAKNSAVTGAVRYPLSPVVLQSPSCIACAVAHFRLAIAPSQVILLFCNLSSRFQASLRVSFVLGALALLIICVRSRPELPLHRARSH